MKTYQLDDKKTLILLDKDDQVRQTWTLDPDDAVFIFTSRFFGILRHEAEFWNPVSTRPNLDLGTYPTMVATGGERYTLNMADVNDELLKTCVIVVRDRDVIIRVERRFWNSSAQEWERHDELFTLVNPGET